MIEIFHDFRFEAAHRLPNVSADHKCSRLHGHSYKVTIHMEGEPDPDMGWFIDFGDLERIVRPVIDMLDHRLLNDIEGLMNPTSEVIAAWIYDVLASELPLLTAVTVCETNDSGSTFRQSAKSKRIAS